jgi:hypothetical protein
MPFYKVEMKKMKNSIKYLVFISLLSILFISMTRGYAESNLQSIESNSISAEENEIELQENMNFIELPEPKPIPVPIPIPLPTLEK